MAHLSAKIARLQALVSRQREEGEGWGEESEEEEGESAEVEVARLRERVTYLEAALLKGGGEEEEMDVAAVMQFLQDTQEVSGEAELSFSDVLPAMLNAGFSEKQCAAILREILSGGEADAGGDESETGGWGGEAGLWARASMLAVQVCGGLEKVVEVCGEMEEELEALFASALVLSVRGRVSPANRTQLRCLWLSSTSRLRAELPYICTYKYVNRPN